MRMFIRLAITSFVLSFALNALTQESGYHFREIEMPWAMDSENPGLYQDDLGYLWIATKEGLVRYDGSRFFQFSHDPDNPGSLPYNILSNIKQGRDGRLLLLSDGGGVLGFDPATGKFETFPQVPINASDILETESGSLWVTSYGIQYISADRQETATYIPGEQWGLTGPEVTAFNSVNRLIQDPENPSRIWLGTSKDLLSFDLSSHLFTRHPFRMDGVEHPTSTIRDFHFGEDGKLFIATWNDGLLIYDPHLDTWQQHRYDQSEPPRSIRHTISQILPRPDGKLWLVMPMDSVRIFDPERQRYCEPTTPDRFPTSLGEGVTFLLPTGNGGFWVKKPQHQLWYAQPRSHWFEKMPVQGRARAVLTQPDGRMLLGSYGKIYLFSPEGLLQDSIPVPVGGTNHFITGLATLSNGKVILVTNNRLYEVKDNALQPFLLPAFESIQELSHGYALAMRLDDQDGLWIATKRRGLLYTPPGDETVIHKLTIDLKKGNPELSFYSDLFQARDRAIWASNDLGVVVTKDRGRTFEYLSINNASCLAEDQQGRIWIGTYGQGLAFLNPEYLRPDSIHWLKPSPGLPTDQVHAITTDQRGFIWAGHLKGLSRIDPISLQAEFFGPEHGLAQTNFLETLPDGSIIAGTDAGTFRFDPAAIPFDTLFPSPHLEYFRVFGRDLPLDTSIVYLHKLTLDHDQNFFTIGFSTPEFMVPERIRYQYRLMGLNENWTTVPQGQPAVFTGLSPGHYRFQLRASDPNGKWPESGWRELAIRIHPPWWATWWMILLYALTIVLGAWQALRFSWRRRLEREETRRLRELDEVKNRLYANITHEFRTPLTLILGSASQIEKTAGSQTINWVKAIRRNSYQLLRLINQMLDLAKLESKRLELHFVQADLNRYLLNLTENFQSLAKDRKLDLVYSGPAAPVRADFDPVKLLDIVSNLVSNAIKFTPGGGKVILRLAAIEADRQVRIEVEDTGIGIPEAQLPRIFNRFYQADDSPTRPWGGTGIGLSLVKELVSLWEGKISVESTPEKGTTFTVLLPWTRQAPPGEQVFPADSHYLETEAQKQSLQISTTGETDGEPPLLLVVEDNSDLSNYLVHLLHPDFRVIAALDGQQGLEAARETIPDIILSDVMMPRMDGLELLRHLREDQLTSHIPVILLTAKSTQLAKLEGFSGGADGYLTKPFDEMELRLRLHKLLERQQQIQAHFKTPGDNGTTPSPLPRENAFLVHLRETFEAHIQEEDYGIPELCRELAVSRMQLHRKLTALTGKSASHYLRSIRLHKAKKLLATTDLNISEVGYEVGFRNPAHFSTAFSQEFGYPPSEERR
ncbi:MAG: response regulator [Lewinellaceae bacterium]|nr:response regulator [Lewinellaceae bacterium]